MSRKHTTPLERLDALLDEYRHLEERAEKLIEEHISGLLFKAPGIPRTVLRQCAVDGRADGYSYPTALRHLRTKLLNES
jgi:hypothetical protein